MLRFEYMPSDFEPIFLFIGYRDELVQFVDILREFEKNPRDLDVRESIPETEGRSRLVITHREELDAPYGVHPTTKADQFELTLNAWQAGQVAERIEKLLPPELKSGNDIIEFGIEGEIPLKVSRGEFTDNFLTPKHHLHPDYVEPASKD